MDEVNKVIEQADLEMKYENIISRIERDWDHMKLKVAPYTPGSVNFILSDSDLVFDMIEDHLSTLESVHRSKNASHVKEKIEEWIRNLIIMRENLDKWMEAQNNWIYLDPIFASSEIQDALPQDYKQFLELQDLNKRIYFSAYLNPKAFYNLVVNNRAEVFNHLINYFSRVKKAVDNYLESRRLRYPRFFFLSDSDFLEFLTKTGAKQDINRFIHQLFPGASSLLISTSEQE